MKRSCFAPNRIDPGLVDPGVRQPHPVDHSSGRDVDGAPRPSASPKAAFAGPVGHEDVIRKPALRRGRSPGRGSGGTHLGLSSRVTRSSAKRDEPFRVEIELTEQRPVGVEGIAPIGRQGHLEAGRRRT